MFIELVDALRCPATHEESWLVARRSAHGGAARLEGTLGCPVCRARVSDPRRHRRLHRVDDEAPRGAPVRCTPLPPADAPRGDAGPRRRAGLRRADSARGALAPTSCSSCSMRRRSCSSIRRPASRCGHGLSGIRARRDAAARHRRGARRRHRLARASTRVADAARVTRVGGRVGRARRRRACRDGVRELARDDVVWVGERRALPSAPVTLHVRRG